MTIDRWTIWGYRLCLAILLGEAAIVMAVSIASLSLRVFAGSLLMLLWTYILYRLVCWAIPGIRLGGDHEQER